MRILTYHRRPVRAIAYSPDGQWLASGSDDGEVVLWNLLTAKVERTMSGHNDWIRGVQFSPDGRYLASASWDNSVRQWPMRKLLRVRPWSQQHGGAWSLTFSPDSKKLVAGWGDGSIEVMTEFSKIRKHYRHHSGPVSGMIYTPDGNRLITVSHDRSLILWDANWFRLQQVIEPGNGWLRSVDRNDGGTLIACGSDEGTIFVYSLPDGKEQQRWRAHTRSVMQVRFLPRSTELLSVGWDGVVRQWQVGCSQEKEGRYWDQGRVNCLDIAPDGMTAAVGTQTGNIILWDME